MDDTISGAIALLLEVFPADVRRRPLGWEALRASEDVHGVVLPEPYRTFVAEISNGTDDGPPEEDGLLRLGEKPSNWASWEADFWMSPEPFSTDIANALFLDDVVAARLGEEGNPWTTRVWADVIEPLPDAG
ncbi:hypothetical protein ABZ070_07185 [Streptomyces sp. NPDC006283]|uniref:hypothetical protein n=1 Tax=Streptomyces sp. NPDC006283 TaxID=3156741 RepID=UPI0033A39ADA